MNSTRRRASLLLVASLTLFAALGGIAAAGYGDLDQPSGTAGCVNLDGSSQCLDGAAVALPNAVAYSTDGANVYVGGPDGVAVFDRDTTTGVLTQKQGSDACVDSDAGNGCDPARGFNEADDIAVSPDGENLYVVDVLNDSLAVLDIEDDGSLTQSQQDGRCVYDQDNAQSGCNAATAFDGPATIAVAPDGEHVYVGTYQDESVIVFDRDSTGELNQKNGTAGCITGNTSNECGFAYAVSPNDLAVDSGGQTLYAPGYAGMAILDIGTDGSLSPTGQACISNDGDTISDGEFANDVCDVAPVLTGSDAVTISPDDANVYVAVSSQNAIATFARDGADGTLEALPGKDSCLSADAGGSSGNEGCRAATEIAAEWIAMAPDGRSVLSGGESLAFPNPSTLAVSTVKRDIATGALRQSASASACVSNGTEGSNPVCAVGRNLDYPSAAAVSPDGAQVVVANRDGAGGVALFDRSLVSVPAPRKVTLAAKPKSVRKGGQARLSGKVAAPEDPVACAERQKVKLSGGGSSQTKRTNAKGAFSFTVKPKRTARYTASVTAGGLCAAAKSKPVRVTVKGKRRG